MDILFSFQRKSDVTEGWRVTLRAGESAGADSGWVKVGNLRGRGCLGFMTSVLGGETAKGYSHRPVEPGKQGRAFLEVTVMMWTLVLRKTFKGL